MALTLSGTNKIVNDNLNTEVKTLFTPKNWIINGGFDVWQRGTTASLNANRYLADDRWSNYWNFWGSSVSRQQFTIGQTLVPNNPTYFSRVSTTTIAEANPDMFFKKEQRIEDVTKLAGKTVSFSFWAKASKTAYMSSEFIQNFGTGGSSDVNSIGIEKFTLTTSWQRFTKIVYIPSVNGKTIGANNYLSFGLFYGAGSNLNSRTNSIGLVENCDYDIANVSLVEGSVPVEWQTEAYADVLRQCQRYYQRFSSISGFNQALGGIVIAENTTGAYGNFRLNKMRIPPTSIDYSNVKLWRIVSGRVDVTAISLLGVQNDEFCNVGITSSGLSANLPCFIDGQNAYIGFNAEL